LRVAADSGTAVIINRPFAGGVMFERTRDKPLPDWAREFGVESWAQFFLKWILGNNAVTCAIPATRNPKYLLDNMAAGIGRLPDQAMRKRMSEYFDRL
jgi:aryl-alcohol dehydrogenase-like predicted oxidoreductase